MSLRPDALDRPFRRVLAARLVVVMVVTACSSGEPDLPPDKPAIDKPVVDKPVVDAPAVDPPAVDAPAAVEKPVEAGLPDATDTNKPPVLKRRPAGSNTPSPGSSPEVKRGLEPEVVRKVVMANVTAIRNCYTRELAKRPDVDGKIGVTFVIGPTGDVIKSLSASGDRVVGDCINALIERAKFPPPPGGGTVTINYPFVFTPSE